MLQHVWSQTLSKVITSLQYSKVYIGCLSSRGSSTSCASSCTWSILSRARSTWLTWFNPLLQLHRVLVSGLPAFSCIGSQCWKASSVRGLSVTLVQQHGTLCRFTFRAIRTQTVSKNIWKHFYFYPHIRLSSQSLSSFRYCCFKLLFLV